MFVPRKRFRWELLIGVTVALLFGCAAFVYGLRTPESMMTFGNVFESNRTVHARGDHGTIVNLADGAIVSPETWSRMRI